VTPHSQHFPAFRDDLYEKLTHPLEEVYRAQWQNRREADTIIIHAKKVSALTIES
jgi:hypothetical protein